MNKQESITRLREAHAIIELVRIVDARPIKENKNDVN